MRLVRFFRSPLGWGRCVMMLVLMGAAWQAEAVNLNTATTQQLQQIKGIGPKTAERIIEERDRAGPYSSLQDLSDRIKGIGPKRLLGLQNSGLHLSSTPPSSNEKNPKNKTN